MRNKFDLQDGIDKLLEDYDFHYAHTLNDYEHYYYREDGNWTIMFNPDEEEFLVENHETKNLLENGEITLEKIEEILEILDDE
jgi:hypothetical protein